MSVPSLLKTVGLVVLVLALPAEYLLRHAELSPHQRRRILYRALGTLVGAAAVAVMADAVDSGITGSWRPAAQVAWGIGLIGLTLAAAFLYAQAIAIARGTELPFLRDPTQAPSRRKAFRFAVLGGGALMALVLLVHATPIARARLALAVIGLFCILLTLLRPSGFGDARGARDLRALLGDPIVTWLYIAFGIAIIILAFTVHLD